MKPMSSLTGLFTGLAVQGMLLGVGGLLLLSCASRLHRRYGAGWLCRLWLTLAVLFLLPVHVLLPPLPARVTAPLPQVLTEPAGTAALPVDRAEITQQDTTPLTELVSDEALPSTVPSSAMKRVDWLAVLWLAGVVAVLTVQLGGYLLWRRRALRTAQAPDEIWQEASRTACRAVLLNHPPRLTATPAVSCPMVAGVLRPVLLVPVRPLPGASCMLIHELTHIRRRDVAFKLLLVLATAVHWYNPAVWLLQKRAVRDIESACDAAVLQGGGAPHRAAYAEALLAAVQAGRGPALSTGFALSKREFKARLADVWDTAPKRRGILQGIVLVLLCVNLAFLVSCDADRAAQDIPSEPEMTTSVSSSPEQIRAALEAAQACFEENYTGSGRFAVCQTGLLTPATPEEYFEDTGWSPDAVDASLSESRTAGEYLATADVQLVKVYFYAEYQPEILYLGPQYSDGNVYVYMAVEPERTTQISGWLSASPSTGAHPTRSEEAKALGLTQRQYLMLTHQTASLYAAGLANFDSPDALTDEELARYLVVRGKTYFEQPDDWMKEKSFWDQTARMILNIDFSAEQDVWSAQGILPLRAPAWQTEWTTRLPEASAPAPLAWSYMNEGGTITAAGMDSAGNIRQVYTFGIFDGGTEAWTARTYCTGGMSYE